MKKIINIIVSLAMFLSVSSGSITAFAGETVLDSGTEKIDSEVNLFDELLLMNEEDFQKYCLENNLRYITPENADFDLRNHSVVCYMVKPQNYLKEGIEDITVSYDIHDLKRDNTYDYDMEKMISCYGLPEKYYTISSYDHFDIYGDSEINEETGEMKDIYFKLARLSVNIVPEYKKSESATRLNQLMYTVPEQCEDFMDFSVMYTGGGNTDTDINAVKGDLNSDGTIAANDLLIFKTWFLNDSENTDLNRAAADLNDDGEINIADYCLLKEMILGTDKEDNDPEDNKNNNSEDSNGSGMVTVRIVNAETGELFNEDHDGFHVSGIMRSPAGAGGGAHVDVGVINPSIENPVTFKDLSSDFSYQIDYISKQYDGYSYYIDTEMNDTFFDFNDELKKEITVYVRKFVWGNNQ